MATIVFGLDGANWPLVEPWLNAGELPNIQRMREEGLWGISESVLPPVTCPNWKCYASSRTPDTHDVYWWEKVNKETIEIDIPNSGSFTSPELWDYLNDTGISAGVMNLPMSYPPREIDGFMIAGGPRSREENYTYPGPLEARLEQEDSYRVHPETVVTSNSGEGVEPTLELIETRFRTAKRLLDESDIEFLHLTIFHLNVLQHYFWNGDPVYRAWKRIDEAIGKFLDKGHTVFLMSDHGCTDIDTAFYINEWLQQEGHLSMETTAVDYMMRAGLTQERVAKMVRSMGLETTIRKLVPRRLVDRVPDDEGIKRDSKFDKIEQDGSLAVASGQGLVYVLVPPTDARYEPVRSTIVDRLGELTTPNGTPVANEIHLGDELYPSGDPMYRPDIIFEQGPGVHTSGAVGRSELMAAPGQWAAENVRDGLFLAHGDDVSPAGDIGRISILDIAPTVLYSMGEPIPESFEGTPIEAVDAGGDDPTYRSPLTDRDDARTGDSEAVQQRLADLGYLE